MVTRSSGSRQRLGRAGHAEGSNCEGGHLLGSRRLPTGRTRTNQILDVSDGDTPRISMSVRMLSVDTSEVHYPGTTNPAKNDGALQELAQWISQGKAPIDPGLGSYLVSRLQSGKAGTLQKAQGDAAPAAFRSLLDEKVEAARQPQTWPARARGRSALRSIPPAARLYGARL